MKPRPPHSLRRRLLVLVQGTLATVWLAMAALTWWDTRHELDELLDSHLAQAAALLVAQQAHDMDDDDTGVDAPTLHRYAPKVAFQVFHEGRLALRSANAGSTPMVAGDRPAAGFSTVQIDGLSWRVFTARGAERDVQVYVGEQLASRNAILWAVLRSTLGPMLAALPLLGLVAAWAIHRGVLPLRRLSQLLSERAPHALDEVALPEATTEMAPMLDALNRLFQRIATLMESERRFTADAAHELRTPIAAIRTQAQVALAETDDALRRHALLATLQGCDRAARLVDQLLTLSRLEAQAPAPSAAPADLAALARQVVADAAPAAIARQQQLELDADAACPVRAEGTLLTVLARNLVDNAIRYSPAGATIRVRVAPHERGARLQVQDSGPGLAEADLQRLGERFFRVLGTGESGSGLGWSIVRRIAAVQGAQVQVSRSAELGGLCVDVQWPA